VPSLDGILASWESGMLSSPLALMEMLVVTKDYDEVERFLASGVAGARDARHDDLRRMLVDNGHGCRQVAGILHHDAPLRDLSDVRALFDRAVEECEEASVALYSLGSATILESATDEIVRFLEEQRVLGAGRKVLDLGCGIGRFEMALSSRVERLVGVDLSPNMVAVARRRTSGLANVRIDLGDGLDLAGGDGEFDLALAIDSMPYLVGLGDEVLDANFAEIARVLRRGGDFVILEFSYRENLDADRRDLSTLADRFGFDVVVNGSSPFALWTGRAFRLRR
jgi:SAM-dependent methyltransferase